MLELYHLTARWSNRTASGGRSGPEIKICGSSAWSRRWMWVRSLFNCFRRNRRWLRAKRKMTQWRAELGLSRTRTAAWAQEQWRVLCTDLLKSTPRVQNVFRCCRGWKAENYIAQISWQLEGLDVSYVLGIRCIWDLKDVSSGCLGWQGRSWNCCSFPPNPWSVQHPGTSCMRQETRVRACFVSVVLEKVQLRCLPDLWISAKAIYSCGFSFLQLNSDWW